MTNTDPFILPFIVGVNLPLFFRFKVVASKFTNKIKITDAVFKIDFLIYIFA